MNRAVTVRRSENKTAWYIRHPITGVEFVTYSVEKMKETVLWLYSRSKFILGNVYR